MKKTDDCRSSVSDVLIIFSQYKFGGAGRGGGGWGRKYKPNRFGGKYEPNRWWVGRGRGRGK